MTEKKKVLVVEDNAINAKLLTVFLEEGGFEVIHAEDGDKGAQKLVEQPDTAIILLDRFLPNMDGLDVLMRFKRNLSTARIPVIMLTAALNKEQTIHAKNVGAYACLPKPYNKEKIISTIKAALGITGQ